MGGEGLVDGRDRPLVRVHIDVGLAGRDHRLDREGHAFLKTRAPPRRAVVRNLGVLVIRTADAVSDKDAHDGEARLLDDDLDGVRDVGEMVAGTRLLDPGVERLAADVEQPLRLGRDLADGQSHRAVGDEAVERDAEVDGDQVALTGAVVVRNPVYDHRVRRDAERSRKTLVALGGWLPTPGSDVFIRDAVELAHSDPGLELLGDY